MDIYWLLYIATFATAFGISLVSTPLAKVISVKVGAIDYPKKRGMHNIPMPRLGGIAIVLGFIGAMCVMIPFVPELRTTQFIGFAIGGIIIVILGIADDIFHLKARNKLVFQIIAALIVVYSGTEITFISYPHVFRFIVPFTKPITVIWIIGVLNAVNLIDGLDGLAAGVSTISSMCLMILCIMSGNTLAAIFTVTLAGSCLGFLPRNFSPAEVYMGDTGATFLGYVLAVSSLIGVYKSYAILSVVIAFFALALPIFDTLFAMIRRAISGKSLMTADRGHLHHRLIDRGFTTQQTAFILYGISIAAAIISIVIASGDILALIITLVFILVFFSMIYVYRKRMIDRNAILSQEIGKETETTK